ncbi:MAG: hypothetical protein A2571_01550 [Candidatus Vogelbacteria bacterium RIFOXYD1_FULL_44_32]|uniref:Uncharacterized protein n=1 Tax=Candidatus Vogelbacteria bacterium RIFOXYD1_FULL_44_32 TaxID=1802438 RepID=A0A1G2QD06_9BACT|nr:MAG: hypothetical protein A2571_01550 [Candidatus Vogelbacteria bacterium RIFOXYD1_FULL_44_32]
MKRKLLIIVTSVTLIILGGAMFLYYFWFVAPEKKIALECQNFVPSWLDFIECSGVVAINDGWDMDYISLKDHVHDYEIARVYDQKQYLFVENKLFVINQKYIENSASDNVEVTYYHKLFQNGKLIENSYGSISDIPTYLIVDTKTGEVKAYKDLMEASEAEKKYFSEIE